MSLTTKIKLDFDTSALEQDFFEETRLLGITASIKNYQFCWQLNKATGYNFRLNTSIEIQKKKRNRDYFFPVYDYRENNAFLTHYIYHNHCDGEYLLPEFKHMDFLWLMKGDTVSNERCGEYLHIAKTISGVQMVAELTIEKITNKENMVF